MGLLSGILGGGDSGAGDMVKYGKEALKLQEKIYNQTREDSQPWYKTGVSAVSRLQDLMGLSGGSVKTREQLMKELTPQYTTTSSTPAGKTIKMVVGTTRWNTPIYKNVYVDGGGPAQTTSTVNYDGLNKAVDEALASQGTPDGYGDLSKSFTMDDFQADPGYQFRQSEGQKAIDRKMAATGKTFSPEAAKALAEYNSNIASDEYATAYNRFNNDQNNLFNRLATLSGFGQTANQTIAGAGQNYASTGSDTLTGIGNTIAAGKQASNTDRSSMFGNLAQAAAMYWSSDPRLKRDIRKVGERNGHNIYQFRYHGDDRLFEGVMADEVFEKQPEAVRTIDGFMAVNYDAIGIEFKEVSHGA